MPTRADMVADIIAKIQVDATLIAIMRFMISNALPYDAPDVKVQALYAYLNPTPPPGGE